MSSLSLSALSLSVGFSATANDQPSTLVVVSYETVTVNATNPVDDYWVINRGRLISDGASIGSLTATNGLLTIKNDSVVNGGVMATQGSVVSVADSAISNSSSFGLVVSQGSSGMMTNSSVSGAGTGLSVTDKSEFTLSLIHI
ncbi:hypothetical protein QN391_23745, partial [Pseudomonas sp. CCI1.2]|uniref:hypothetical protein n=1 Tax=Pseudomonas sp. CCI1.2 TaxID=3048614 RepID=UPI002B23AF28